MTGLLLSAALFCALSVTLFLSTRGSVRSDHVEATASVVDASPLPWEFFRVALGLRIVVSIGIILLDLTFFFAPDGFAYERAGFALAQIWRGEGYYRQILETAAQGRVAPYHYYNGISFSVFGDAAPYVIRFFNCCAGAASVPVAHRLAATIFDANAGRIAAQMIAFTPSMVLWSAVNCRDAWAVLGILLAVEATVRLRTEVSFKSVATLTGSLALLGAVRGYMFLLIVAALVISSVLSLGRNAFRSYFAALVTLAAFSYLYSRLNFGREMLDIASLESLNAAREGLAAGGSAFHEGADISTPGRAIAFVPVGVTYFLFAPFPWAISGVRQALTVPETFLWWFLVAKYFLPGVRYAFQTTAAKATTLMMVLILVTIAYGLVEGNVGTAYRHRAQVLPLFFVFIAGGIAFTRQKQPVERIA